MPSSPAAEAALVSGKTALQARRFNDALSAFKRASDLQKQQSGAAFFGDQPRLSREAFGRGVK